MLTLSVVLSEGFDEENESFVPMKTFELEMEHSLVSLSKWERFFKKPFLSDKEKSSEETLWYVKAMCLTTEIPPEVFLKLSQKNVDEINAYISDPMTATTFREIPGQKPNREIMTSEVLYYYMIALGIPFECQYWHLGSLLTLIKVCNQKNAPSKKVPRREALERQRDLNRQRKEQLGTSG